MLVILSFALVLVAVVLLVLGLLASEGLGLIYASMACSLAAGIVLYAAVRMGRPSVQEATAGAPASATARPAAAADAGERAVAASAPEREALGTVAVLEREPAEEDTAALAAVPTEDFDEEAEAEEDFFPIAEYDDLTVGEIMPLLPELYPEELDEVEERERTTKSRVTILSRISELRDEVRRREAGEEWGVPEEGWRDEEEEEEVAGAFPIDGYDDMTAPEVVKNLDRLGPSELAQVRAREADGDRRVTVLREIDDRLEGAPAVAAKRPAKKAAAKRKAATKKAATKKRAATKKAGAKKAATKKAGAKKAATKKRAATKKAGAKKAAAKKSTAKKSTAKKSTAKKSTAKKSARRR